MIENVCALVKLKSLPDNSQDFIFGDPPYALGSTVYIDTDGKPKYKEAKDFMNKWEMPDHAYWEEFFKVAEQKLKFGGRILFFGIDRQLFLFQYYAVAAGLEIKQSLYWYFISNFPKATDLSKQIEKRLGVDVIEGGAMVVAGQDGKRIDLKSPCKQRDYTHNSETELGKKYEGYKYSISPLKQVLETVMVFQKRTKNKSILDDVFAFENGDETISPSIWAIDEGRVPTSEEITNHSRGAKSEEHTEKYNLVSNKQETHQTYGQKLGRYPSQMFIDSTCASKIDEQSGITKGSDAVRKNNNFDSTCYGKFAPNESKGFSDEAGASKILHHIGYLDEELDLVFYSPKVSTFEREHGCGDIEKKEKVFNGCSKTSSVDIKDIEARFTTAPTSNNHPTLKPIKLIYQIAKLLKAPFPQNVFFPFSGAGSEIIGFEQAEFNEELFSMSELDVEFVGIAEARRKAWRELDIDCLDENKKHLEKRSKEHKRQESLF